ncbi:hypothetical protein [uncultured Desulfuromonas sp.]|uniref:hypothetical protein n=1 Tax=uncultured Desulfuromonas sp. TaxID=181013 RepID=UPI002626283E|nr:hypothetical protein [uncultured Desulfuromonas sp.]
MRHAIYVSLFCLLFLSLAGNCFAGAWTLERGKAYNRFAVNYFFADEEFDGDGNGKALNFNGEFTEVNGNYYVEYGVFNRLTAIASLYYKDIEQEDNAVIKSTKGIGDVELGLKYGVANWSGGAVAAQGLVKIPGAYDESPEGGTGVPLGNGQYDGELRLLYGQSLWALFPGYCGVEIGYRWRAEAPADELRYLVEVGTDFSKSLYGRAKLDGIKGMNNGGGFSSNRNNPNEFDLVKLDLATGFKVTPRWSLEAGYAPAISGESALDGTTYTLALTYQP